MLAALLPALVPILGDAIRRLFPDPAEAAKAQAELNNALMANAAKIEEAAASIIADEAKSEHWLASSWRPLVMLTFTALIVARWLGYSAPGISEAEVLKLWDIVQLGLGGYVIGRSAEKIVPQLAQMVARR
ncbi:MAG: 3TM-type holin [Burkholderiales bacterium]|nr:3TM-type holin [Burkholderiales bacterium]